jgi:hypothetical protein
MPRKNEGQANADAARNALIVISLVSAAIGFQAERNTNQVADGRVTTVDACLERVPHERTINAPLLRCLQVGANDGNRSGESPLLEVGLPIESVQDFRAQEESEAESLDLHTPAIAAVAAPAVIAVGVMALD